jgi:hypothetical protein
MAVTLVVVVLLVILIALTHYHPGAGGLTRDRCGPGG